MAHFHPSGITIEILGTEESSNGQSCEEHAVCGSAVDLDVVVRLHHVQISDPDADNKEAAIAAHWKTDGVDQCCVGFLGRCTVKHWKECDGKLAQIVDICSKESDSPWQKVCATPESVLHQRSARDKPDSQTNPAHISTPHVAALQASLHLQTDVFSH